MQQKLYQLYFLVGFLLFCGSVINFIIEEALIGLGYLAGAFLFIVLGFTNRKNKTS